MERVPSNWQYCATCVYWCGRQLPDTLCSYVEYDATERARCAGGVFNGSQMNATSCCSKWQQRFERP